MMRNRFKVVAYVIGYTTYLKHTFRLKTPKLILLTKNIHFHSAFMHDEPFVVAG